MKRILFVCTGNSCRSPMAEAYFNALGGREGGSAWRALSAGLFACPGAPASPQSARVMGELEIPMDGFRSRRVTPELLDSVDLCIGMTRSHLAELRLLDRARPEKYHLLLEWDDSGVADVPDPYAGSVAAYRTCFEIMRPALERLFKALNDRKD